jgi:tyrosine-protein phosphatase
MLAQREMNTDSSPLKRSFTDTVGRGTRHDPLLYLNHAEDYAQNYSPIRPEGLERSQSAFPPRKRRSISISRSISMPSQSSSATSAVFPSFMSIFGAGGRTGNAGQEKPLQAEPKQQDEITTHELPTRIHHTQHSLPTPRDHCRSDSVSSVASTSESTESSPTTTSSTFDSPIIAEPSPGSSPETPNSALPGLSFRSMTRPAEHAHKNLEDQDQLPADMSSATILSDPATETPRNVKNLSLKPTPTILTRPATSSGVDGMNGMSPDSSPLRETIKTGRRKPPGLSIQTPGFATSSFIQNTSNVPPTPSTRPSLTHVQSSPQFPTMVASAGGLRLPMPLNLRGGHSRPGSESSSNLSFGNSLPDVKEEIQPPMSQEVVERGYPNGPVLIYDCGVYLFLEPTAQEASKFDTVINVAKEVKNPFDATSTGGNETVLSALRKEDNRSQIPEPQTAISEISFRSAYEWPSSAASTTPTTPKASSAQGRSQPQYIHVPWDHNSEIVDDLYPLCRLIDNQVDAGKKVLIHCQLGVSRSASLIIAYGLYKGYKTNFHTMYETVKERSQWVGPNMTLIYQLNDFRSKVEKGSLAATSKTAPREWFRSQGPTNETTLTPLLTTISTSIPDKLSMTPPAVHSFAKALQAKTSKPDLNKQLPPVPPFEFSEVLTKTLEPSVGAAQPRLGLPTQEDSPPELPPKSAVITRPLPLRDFAGLQEIPPHRPQEAGGTTARRVFSFSRMDLAMSEEPQTPSLFSPRATEFLASAFGRTQAGEIMIANKRPSAIRSTTRDTIAPEIDPRAPHQTQEGGEIVRNIDEVL